MRWIAALTLVVGGCANTQSVEELRKIEEDCAQGLAMTSYGMRGDHWYYIGSDDSYDWVVHNFDVFGNRDTYRVPVGELSITQRFNRTRDRRKWISMDSLISPDPLE